MTDTSIPYFTYTSSRDGIIDTENDGMYVMDDFGYLVRVPFCLFADYFCWNI